MLNELFIIQLIIFINLWFFLKSLNILILWYLSGILLLSLGVFLLVFDGDIFVGFLWIIDLGVGLIFFIFILHFSNFLYQKISTNIFHRYFIWLPILIIFITIFYFFLHENSNFFFNVKLKKYWYFFLSNYNFYDIFYLYLISNLSLLREIYFFNNSLEFFIINFIIFYGIFSSIIFFFLIKSIFNLHTSPQFKNFFLFHKRESSFFIRNQNFIKQQNTSTGSRVWSKKNFKFCKIILKHTWLEVADNTNVCWLQTFQLYKGFHRKFTKLGFFVKGSAQIVEPPRLEYKGFKYKFSRKGAISRGFIIRSSYPILKKDGGMLKFYINSMITLKKKQEPKSKFHHGATSFAIKRKKFILLFKSII